MPGGGALRGKGPGLCWLKGHVGYCGDDCLIWPFHRLLSGYGQLGYCGKIVRAHRIMCELVHGGPPAPEYHAAHSCNNGHLGCVNPRHLSWQTPADNRKSANTRCKGRAGREKLTFAQVQTIRASDATQKRLATAYGVHPNTIAKIIRGEAWVTPLAIRRGS